MNILVVYDSYRGHTQQFAEAVAEGAQGVIGAEVKCLSVAEATKTDIEWADGVALGCPTHMGSMSWQMKRFIDEEFGMLWVQGKLPGRVGAVFVTAGSGGTGGGELAMLTMLSTLAQNGFILVSHPRNSPGFKPDGMHWGPVWSTGPGGKPDESNLLAARAHGRRLAEVTAKLRG